MMVVVDACVLRSASESDVPLPKQCREALDAVRKGGRTVVACKTLQAEWRNHRSLYSQCWLTSMYAKRRVKVVDAYLPRSQSAEHAISRLAEPLKSHGLKDVHLLRLAIDNDGMIVSSERRCRESFSAAKSSFAPIGNVAFVDPAAGEPLHRFLCGTDPIDPTWKL